VGRIAKRLGKVVEFLALPSANTEICAWPWESEDPPYHIVTKPNNSDGRGEYSRRVEFDDDGVPFRTERGRRLYDPLVVARYGLKMLSVGKATGEDVYRRRAGEARDALLRTAATHCRFGRGGSSATMHAEHPSAMVQGIVASFLLRAPRASDSDENEVVARRALAEMLVALEAGGARSRLQGSAFLEEFPQDPPSHVLNGCIFGLFGLYDAADSNVDPAARAVAAEVEATLESTISRFTTRTGWSRYALNVGGIAPRASVHYHLSHIRLLRVVAARTQGREISHAIETWSRARDSFLARGYNGAVKVGQVVWLRNIRRLPLNEG